MAKEKWINKAIDKPGALRRTTKTKKNETIPVSTLREKAKQPGITGKRARLALTLRGFNKKGK